jgi:hypothetical protein
LGERAAGAGEKLSQTIFRLAGTGAHSDWLLSCLLPFVDPDDDSKRVVDTSDRTEAWCQLLEMITLEQPVVVVIDNLHHADGALLTFLEELTESARPVPLLVIATARTELLQRRPEWSADRPQRITVTLD